MRVAQPTHTDRAVFMLCFRRMAKKSRSQYFACVNSTADRYCRHEHVKARPNGRIVDIFTRNALGLSKSK